MRKQGGRAGVGSCRWKYSYDWCAHDMILAHDLLRESEAQSRVTFQIPFLQGNVEASSVYHTGVRPRDRGCNLAVNLAMHMQNGFVHFCFHESTQIREYEQGLLYKHAINRNNK